MTTRLVLARDEMAFRKIYKTYLEGQSVTVVFRPGRRLQGDFRGYDVGDIVKARVIDQLGLDRASLPPVFLERPTKRIKIISTELRKIGSLVSSDFLGSTPDVFDQASLVFHLGLIYNLDVSELGPEAIVTKITFEYVKL